MSKVKDFKAFMRSKVNESEELEGMNAGMNYGANPEGEEEETLDLEGMEDEEGVEMEEEEVTLEDLKAIVDDLEERLSALEGGEEGEDEEGAEEVEDEEGAEEGEEEEA